MKKGTKSLSG